MIGAQTIQKHMVNVKAFLDLYLPLRSQTVDTYTTVYTLFFTKILKGLE